MLRVLLKIWPALVPIIIFVIWYYKSTFKNADIKVYDVFLERKKKYFRYALIASCVIIISMLLYLGLSQKETPHDINTDQVHNEIR